MQSRTLRFSSLLDEILAAGDLDELREAASVCSRGCIQVCSQIGTREAEARQLARETEDEARELVTVKELCARYGESTYAIRQAIRRGDLKPVPPEPGAKRNGKVRVGEYRRWRAS